MIMCFISMIYSRKVSLTITKLKSQLHDIKVVTGSLIIEAYHMRMLSFHIKSISSSQTLHNLSFSSLVKWLRSRKAPLELFGENMFQ